MLLVTGASGFLGSNIAREAIVAGLPVRGTYHRNAFRMDGLQVFGVDLSQAAEVRDLLTRTKPDWVVNCAAYTNVDDCEIDPDRARSLNVGLPQTLAAECANAGIRMMHVSTDSVFDGRRGGYTEEDSPAPLNVYAQTKLEGEHAVTAALSGALVVRTNFIGLSPGSDAGLADWIAGKFERKERVSGFTDVVFAPLLANEVARIALEMMQVGLQGLYHVNARDSVSKYEFACRLGEALGAGREMVDPTSIEAAGLPARRPMNTSLSPRKTECALGRQMPEVDAAIGGYAELRAANTPALPALSLEV